MSCGAPTYSGSSFNPFQIPGDETNCSAAGQREATESYSPSADCYCVVQRSYSSTGCTARHRCGYDVERLARLSPVKNPSCQEKRHSHAGRHRLKLPPIGGVVAIGPSSAARSAASVNEATPGGLRSTLG